jgi:hypothetical protein
LFRTLKTISTSLFFSGIILILKMGLLRKIKYLQTLEICIWLEPCCRSLSKSRNRFPRFDPQFQELLAEFRGGSESGEQLLSIHALLVKSESIVTFVSSRASSQCFQFADPTVDSPSVDDFLLARANFVFSSEFSPMLSMDVSPFLLYAQPLSPSPPACHHPPLFPHAALPYNDGDDNSAPAPARLGPAVAPPPYAWRSASPPPPSLAMVRERRWRDVTP